MLMVTSSRPKTNKYPIILKYLLTNQLEMLLFFVSQQSKSRLREKYSKLHVIAPFPKKKRKDIKGTLKSLVKVLNRQYE